jgi:NAD(P)-dependent dehydrogenase (short-subunit alcohol dehydrogenase family)
MKALVTGASSGIGFAIAQHLSEEGWLVDGASRRGPTVLVDLSTREGVDLLTSLGCVGGKYGVLVLNHGMMRFDEKEAWEATYATNLGSHWGILEAQRTAKALVRAGGSIIINASVSGVIGDPDVPYYACLKAALINLTRSYAKLLLPQGIRVNCFSCGFFNTNLVEGPTPQHLIDAIPMKRAAEPDEIIPIIDALINCEYITGQNIIVDGGLTL